MNKKTKYMLSEGLKFVAPSFVFDFEHDEKNDVIELNGSLKSSKIFENTYFFQYEFGNDVSSKTRSDFIHALKFDQDLLGKENINKFINKALVNLNKAINLSTVDIILYPQSSSLLTKNIVDKIDYFTDADKYIKIELAKKQISEINFNWSKFEKYCELKNISSNTKEIMTRKMNKMLDNIQSLDYFSIAKNIKDQKYKRFLKNIYKFYDSNSIKLLQMIKDKKILIVDDIYTSGITIEQIIKAYQMLDPDDSNVIIAFTLIGKVKDN